MYEKALNTGVFLVQYFEFSPALTFTPTEEHQIKFAVPFVH